MMVVEAAIEKVSAYHVDMRTNSISSLLKMNLKGLRPDSYKQEDSEFSRYLSPSTQPFFEKRTNVTMGDRRKNDKLFNSSIGAGVIQVIVEEDEEVYRDTTKKLPRA